MSRILSREGADLKVSGNFFKAVVQAVSLFGAETLVLSPRMDWALSSFQNRVARRLTGRKTGRQRDGSRDYPLLAVAMAEVSFEEIVTYVTRRHNTVAQYILTRPILYLYERYSRRPGVWVSWWWWEQEILELDGAKKRAVAESELEEAKSKDVGME